MVLGQSSREINKGNRTLEFLFAPKNPLSDMYTIVSFLPEATKYLDPVLQNLREESCGTIANIFELGESAVLKRKRQRIAVLKRLKEIFRDFFICLTNKKIASIAYREYSGRHG